MTEKDTTPEFKKKAFTCPHCKAYAHQIWIPLMNGGIKQIGSACRCEHCFDYSIWIDERMIYPISSIAPLPAEDMPDDVKEDFNEARDVLSLSPRSAAALLRLSLEKLLNHLDASGRNLDTKIGDLVKNGLPPKIQEALDTVRVIGNNAVHPGQIDLKDDRDTANSLFELMNVIVERMIAQPKKIVEIYSKLPVSKRQAIVERDSQTNTETK